MQIIGFCYDLQKLFLVNIFLFELYKPSAMYVKVSANLNQEKQVDNCIYLIEVISKVTKSRE